MIDLKFIRENPGIVEKALEDRGSVLDVNALLETDSRHRSLLQELETLRHKQKLAGGEIAKLKSRAQNADIHIAGMKTLSQNISDLSEKESALTQKLREMCLAVPNIPDGTVPKGRTAEDNVEVKRWGEQPSFNFSPMSHLELGRALGILSFETAAKIAGSGFAFFRGAGARLVRALVQFMLDLHTGKHGYQEVFPPFLVNRNCMTGTGQLPKLEEDMYRIEQDDLFLIPTAEVPVTNVHREEIIDGDKLPIFYTAYTACFRREAGSYGKETKGLTRLHQFDKVELVKFVRPEDSGRELENLLQDAEEVLQLLGLHYRVVALCAGDLSFAASKCYDIEVWAPAEKKYLEVSSCSNFTDFQARRSGIRYRPEPGAKPRCLHTLNGSGVAVPRLMIALLESCQAADGNLVIPEALLPYMGGVKQIEPLSG